MSSITPPKRVKPIFGFLYKNTNLFDETVERIHKNFSRVDFISDAFPFTETEYYTKEMGSGLLRRYISAEKLIFPDELSHYKTVTNEWEEQTAKNGDRQINIDPGYLHKAKLILASTKDYSHRVYVGRGVYAEVTMTFMNGNFVHLPWTYPDYWNHRNVFMEIRDLYIQQTKQEG
jgi:hypothetical protein